jgi:hypothetical protein
MRLDSLVRNLGFRFSNSQKDVIYKKKQIKNLLQALDAEILLKFTGTYHT